jgi:hypothetical protein
VFSLTVYRAWGAGTFDVTKLPKLLRTMVLDKFVPMSILGIAYFTVTDATTKNALLVAYGGAIVVAVAAEVRELIDAIVNKPELTIGDANPYAPAPPVITPKP